MLSKEGNQHPGWDLNMDHIGGRRVCSPLHLPYSYSMQVQWNLDITNDFLYPVVVKYFTMNLDITKPCYREQILVVPWTFIILSFHCASASVATYVCSVHEVVSIRTITKVKKWSSAKLGCRMLGNRPFVIVYHMINFL